MNYNATGWLVYNDKETLPKPKTIGAFDPVDDMNLVPYDEQERLPEPDRTIELDVDMINLSDGANYAFFNNITYVAPKVPTLMTALSAGKQATDPRVYGEYTHPFVLEKGEVVQIVLNNLDDGRHPFHLHGHHFQALHRSPEDGGTFAESGIMEQNFPSVPMRRDTLAVEPNGNIVLRFRANNPGRISLWCQYRWDELTDRLQQECGSFTVTSSGMLRPGLLQLLWKHHWSYRRALIFPRITSILALQARSLRPATLLETTETF